MFLLNRLSVFLHSVMVIKAWLLSHHKTTSATAAKFIYMDDEQNLYEKTVASTSSLFTAE